MLDPRTGPLSRSRTAALVVVGALALFSLEPVGFVDEALELCFLPSRALPELAAPLRWLGAGEVRAAERDLREGELDARREALALFAAEQDAALPQHPELRAGRRFVHAEVLRSVEGARDRVVVRLATRAGLEPGQPVVSGEHYVGRVEGPDPDHPDRAIVQLVTGSDAFVGAELREERGAPPGARPCRLVVGGLAPSPSDAPGALLLAVHNPSREPHSSGRVVVREGLAEPFAELANDFVLGVLDAPVEGERGGAVLALRPGLDYAGGLFELLVVQPLDGGPDELRLTLDSFDPRGWTGGRALAPMDANPRRHGARVGLRVGHGVEVGAALVLGGHLIGRVQALGPLSADVQRLEDPGLRLLALAQIEGEVAPRVLGELRSLGAHADGGVAFRWQARVPVGEEGDAPRRAWLYTGSGAVGVPRGLRVGEALLPCGPGPYVLRVVPDPRTRSLERGLVWRGLPPPPREGAP